MQTNNKQREALVKAEAVLDGIRMMVLQGQEYDIHLLDIEGSLKKCRAALAAPPRNCDVYDHDEALQVWASEEENEHNGCFDEWLYEIAKEGDEK